MSDLELAWAAGFLDGEGSIHVHRANQKRHIYLRIAIHQVRSEPLDRFTRAVGYGHVLGPYKTKWQPRYQLHYTGKLAHKVWTLLEPYVTKPTREKHEKAMATIEEEYE